MHRDTDGSRLIRNGPGDRLADPPGSIGGKLIPLGIVKLFHRLDKAQISFLNQIQEQHTPSHISFGYADHQTQIGFRQTLFGFFITDFHSLRQIDFLFRRKQGHLAYFLQIHTHRIFNADAVGNGKVDIFHIHFVLFGQDDFLIGNIIVILGDTQHIHIALLQQLQQFIKLILIQLQIRKIIADLLVFQNIFFLSGNADKASYSFQKFGFRRGSLFRGQLAFILVIRLFCLIRFFLCLFAHS